MSDMHDLAAPYVLGALDAAERSSYETHLEACEQCQAEVGRLEDGLIALASQDAERPSAKVRESVLAGIGEGEVVALESRRPKIAKVLVPLVAAAAVLVLVIGIAVSSDPIDDVLAAEDAVSTELTVTDAYDGASPVRAVVVFSETEGSAVVEFEGLATVSSDETYQLWLIADGVASSAGLFQPGEEGEVLVLLEGEPESGETVGVTLEPASGSSSPTGAVLFVAEI